MKLLPQRYWGYSSIPDEITLTRSFKAWRNNLKGTRTRNHWGYSSIPEDNGICCGYTASTSGRRRRRDGSICCGRSPQHRDLPLDEGVVLTKKSSEEWFGMEKGLDGEGRRGVGWRRPREMRSWEKGSVANLRKSEEVFGSKAPLVASLSSRGPNLFTPDILKMMLTSANCERDAPLTRSGRKPDGGNKLVEVQQQGQRQGGTSTLWSAVVDRSSAARNLAEVRWATAHWEKSTCVKEMIEMPDDPRR
ncbi:hypothetical protein ZIOFF_010910 [Zingiber officinale]|uniref:Uncharacterized protein n=1 Tax=Zingiber officinale TaxID=94328 RepID=A0A8J5I4Z5_ZINOF|nr:hypothetical protein ZIOFF_010910 [Zingiber officinale]